MASEEPALPAPVQRNIEHLARIEAEAADRAGRHQHRVERLTQSLARPAALYVLSGLIAGWCVVNALWAHAWDEPPFPWLQGALGLYSAVVVTAVLIAQRREHEIAEHRARIDLQVNLLAEQKATKIIALLEELRRDLPNVADRVDGEAMVLAARVDPSAVHAALEPAPRAARTKDEERGTSPR